MSSNDEIPEAHNEEDIDERLTVIGSYGGMVIVVEDPMEEIMLIWGIQQPTFSKQNAFVAQSSLTLKVDACGQTLFILQSPSSLGTPGVTGSVMWDSGIVLGKFLEHAVDTKMLTLQGKKVIELGSGCGLVGCIAALLGAQCILTDLPDRLRLLRKNVESNLEHGDLRGSAKVDELVWGDDPDPTLVEPSPDYVIGSDVVYSEEAVTNLISTLIDLCGVETTVILAGELRNDAILECFLEAVMKEFVVGRVEQTQWHPDYTTPRVAIWSLELLNRPLQSKPNKPLHQASVPSRRQTALNQISNSSVSASMDTERPSAAVEAESSRKERLGWMEWLRGWMYVVYEFLFQRITASHLENNMELPPLNDLTCIITGSTSGIGLQIARQLAQFGAHVVMAVRNPKAAHELIQKWQNEMSGSGILLNIEVMQVDLLSLDSVANFAEAWNARSAPIHVLINNAGIFMLGESQKFSKDGYEQHMQVNHLAPALLSVLLLPSLLKGSPSRIVNVNSVMHYIGFVDPDDMNVTSGKRKFTSTVGYSSSKLAQVMFNSVLNKRVPAEAGISITCVSPGVVDTNVARDLPRTVQTLYHLIPYFVFSAAEGARSTLFAATDPQIQEYCETLKADEWPTCAFISHDCRPTNPSEESHNTETAFKVWEKTLELIGLPSDAVERLIEGEQVKCRYGAHSD